MNQIILNKTLIENNKVTYLYSIEGNWNKYFTSKRTYTVEYDKDLSTVPISICNIQFVANILPLTWLFDAKLIIKDLDKSFFDSIKNIKKGYEEMYQQLKLKGKIEVKTLTENNYEPKDKVGAFFSGGLDAMSTIASHYEEKPLLINIQGSDLNLKYKNTINKVKKYLTESANNLDLDITFIKSEFRQVINERKVNKYLAPNVHDNYWHGFQHGIAIISHAAVISYYLKLKTIYIASSFTKEDNIPCASAPTIDNNVKLSSTKVKHDGYEFDRSDKSQNIANFIEKYQKPVKLRVCLDDYRVDNCGHCEKCYRTILGFASVDIDPNDVGFKLNYNDYKNMENNIKNKLFIQFPAFWQKIQKSFIAHPKLKEDEKLSWIYDYNFENVNKNKMKYIYKIYYAIIKRINRLKTIIFK